MAMRYWFTSSKVVQSKIGHGKVLESSINDLLSKIKAVDNGFFPCIKTITGGKLLPTYFLSMVVGDLNIDCPVTRTSQLIGDRMNFVAFVGTNVHCHYIHVIVMSHRRRSLSQPARSINHKYTIGAFYEPAFTHFRTRSKTATRRT